MLPPLSRPQLVGSLQSGHGSADTWQGRTFGVVATCGRHGPAPCRPRTPQPGEAWHGAGARQSYGGAAWPWAPLPVSFCKLPRGDSCFFHWALLSFFLSLLGSFHQLPEKQKFFFTTVGSEPGRGPSTLLPPVPPGLFEEHCTSKVTSPPHEGLAWGVLPEGGCRVPAATRWRMCSLLPARPCVPTLLVHTPLHFKTNVHISWSRVQNLYHFSPVTTKYFSTYVLRTQTYFYISTVQLLKSVSWTLIAVYFLHVSLVVPILSLQLFLPVWIKSVREQMLHLEVRSVLF